MRRRYSENDNTLPFMAAIVIVPLFVLAVIISACDPPKPARNVNDAQLSNEQAEHQKSILDKQEESQKKGAEYVASRWAVISTLPHKVLPPLPIPQSNPVTMLPVDNISIDTVLDMPTGMSGYIKPEEMSLSADSQLFISPSATLYDHKDTNYIKVTKQADGLDVSLAGTKYKWKISHGQKIVAGVKVLHVEQEIPLER